ncbi:transcription factor HES-2-like [Myxocyprinus asiaticus]|uniref:transcription factor HES-2-like n=1 Tax=Myxocyprinus asiaticus TaxID=70543 RepID=UPI0022234762|nr:transcription factor HES-2-like [Myxocyprinus asiaticus]
MKMLGETENIKMDRKLLKPQVERRRRERMNRSLENLRTLLLQGPEHNSSTQRRIEKAEILECTVLFLQSSVAVAKKAKDAEGGEKLQFIDGFSTCLQKAAHFLLDEGEVRGLEGSISTTLCQRLSQPCVPANIRLPVRIQNSSRIQVPRSTVQHYLQQRQKQQQNSICKQGLSSACRNIVVHPNRIPFRSAEPNALECHRKTHTEAQPTSHSQAPVSQTVWRPWP